MIPHDGSGGVDPAELMGYRRNAGGGRRDTAEGPIVQALEAVGARVWRLGGTANPDLLVLYRGSWTPLEAKTGKAGRLTKNQTDIPWQVVRSVDEALKAIGAAPEAIR